MRVAHSIEMLRRLGPSWSLYRARYALRRKSGLLKRRFPTTHWDSVRLADLVKPGVPSSPVEYREFRAASSGRFFFPLGELPSAARLAELISGSSRARTIAVADDYCHGRFLFFSSQVFDLGLPPDWLLNPYLGSHHHSDAHWCDYPTFSAQLGDIKEVWEASRFACAFWLVRAYALSHDEKYANAFWAFFESWLRQNPANRGPNWKCGQETGIRLFGWAFALYGFWNTSATTCDRIVAMARMMAIQAERIYHNIDFAISQKNNHSMSEAIGLITVALLFPEMRDAGKWLHRGREVLEADARRQIYDDGSFVQQSTNYHRVMLHDCLWAFRLCELNRCPLSDELRRRVGLAGEFLFEMLDPESGGVPNYGANDGALVLPLSACDYGDFRATVQAASVMKTGRRVLPAGPWDETAFWLHGEEGIKKAAESRTPRSSRFDSGGYYTIRRGRSWCMIRCHGYRDRPAHVDMLHLDLWHGGVNVLSDSGSYKYFTPESPSLEKYFKDIAAHNTIEIGGRGPLDLASRFLWLPWPAARCIEHSESSFCGEHDAYARSPWHVKHRRRVTHESGNWVVTDEISGPGVQEIALRWHLADLPYQDDAAERSVRCELPGGGRMTMRIEAAPELRLSVARGVDTPEPAGWISTRYRERMPRPTVKLAGRVRLPVTLVTHIQFEDDAP